MFQNNNNVIQANTSVTVVILLESYEVKARKIKKTHVFVLIVQFGASGIHTEVSVQVLSTDVDRLNPGSHAYVAVALRVLSPSKPTASAIVPFSGGRRVPQSRKNTYVIHCVVQYTCTMK